MTESLSDQTDRRARPAFPSWLRLTLVALLGLGICFRFTALDRKVYWHDEVYTSFRVAGFTGTEIQQSLFQNRFVSISELQFFQQIKPNSSVVDTLRSLVQEDPQHPPLYFVITRYWMQIFGNSVFGLRLLPALLSLISLPLMYGLAIELFGSGSTALLSTVFLALSPFDILFAQTARQYSLLTAAVIGSSWLLLRAMRAKTGSRWVGYGMSSALGLYTHPFFGLTLIAQGVYVGLMAALKPFNPKTPIWARWRDARLLYFGLATLGALLVYGPWIAVLLEQYDRFAMATDWTRSPVSLLILLKFWVLGFTALWFDLDFGLDNPATYLLRLPFLLLILAAFYDLWRQAPLRTRLFLLTLAFVPFLLLALPDLVSGGKRSSVSRYLLVCFPAVQLAVACFFTRRLGQIQPRFRLGRLFWPVILSLTLLSSVLSNVVSAKAEAWRHQAPSQHNPEILKLLSAEAEQSSPILISDLGYEYTNTGDLISLSYRLNPKVRLFLVSQPPDLSGLPAKAKLFVLRASPGLEDAITKKGWRLTPVLKAAGLSQIQR